MTASLHTSLASSSTPLDFVLRVSDRAKHVRLVICPRRGLVVVVPRGFPADEVPSLVEGKRTWIERSLERLDGRPALFAAGPEALLPDLVEIRACDEALPVEYRHTGSASVRAYRHGGEVVVSGAVGDAAACLAALRRWADREAREHLSALVSACSEATGALVAEVRVGFRRTRWGSCSSRGVLSLNRNLIFLPAHLARAVVLHEMTHLSRRDHSSEFWAQLADVDPRALEHRRELRHAQLLVPPWADG